MQPDVQYEETLKTKAGSTEYRGTFLVPLPVLTVLFQKWYRSTGAMVLFLRSIWYFQFFVITY